MSLARSVKPEIASLQPYQPGKPIEELEREFGIVGAVKLASNENALGPSPRALAALAAALPEVHRYPDGASFALRHKLASRLEVTPAQLVLGAGSDEILELLAKAFLRPQDEVVYAWPSFAMYPIVIQGAGARGVAVPLTSGLVHDLPALGAAVNERTRLVFVCNPNNPTGTSVGAEAFERFVAQLPSEVLLVVDEAYCEYAQRPDFPNALPWIARRPATIVLRTFSKIYGLAGLRVGYGIASSELVGYLERARHPFNVSLLAQVAALAALEDVAHVQASQRNNREGLAFLHQALAALGIEVTPSDANFVLARTGIGTYEQLLREGVIVRAMGGFGLPEHVRITVGLPEENRRLVAALERLRRPQKRAVRHAG